MFCSHLFGLLLGFCSSGFSPDDEFDAIENVLTLEKAEELALKEAAKQAKIDAKAAEEDSKSTTKDQAGKEDAKAAEEAAKCKAKGTC